MSITRVGASSVAGTSISIPTHQVGDLIVISAYVDGVTTTPTKPAAGGTVPSWVDIDNPSGANLNAMRSAYFQATATTTTSGTWTGATGMSVAVYRGHNTTTPIGDHAQSGSAVTSGANMAVPAMSLAVLDGTSVFLAVVGYRTVTAWSAAPSGYTQISQVATEMEQLEKNSTTTDGTFNVTATSSGNGGYRTQYIEILVAPPSTTPVSKTAALAYTVIGRVADTLALAYKVAGRVAPKTVTPNYKINVAVAKTSAFAYSVRAIRSKTLATSYNVQGTVSKTLAPSYKVATKLSKALSASYSVQGRVGKAQGFSYSIAAVFISVLKSRSLNYNVRTSSIQSIVLYYGITGPVGRSVEVKYNVVGVVIAIPIHEHLLQGVKLQQPKLGNVKVNL